MQKWKYFSFLLMEKTFNWIHKKERKLSSENRQIHSEIYSCVFRDTENFNIAYRIVANESGLKKESLLSSSEFAGEYCRIFNKYAIDTIFGFQRSQYGFINWFWNSVRSGTCSQNTKYGFRGKKAVWIFLPHYIGCISLYWRLRLKKETATKIGWCEFYFERVLFWENFVNWRRKKDDLKVVEELKQKIY